MKALILFAALFLSLDAHAKSWTYSHTICADGTRTEQLLYPIGSVPVNGLTLSLHEGKYWLVYRMNSVTFGVKGSYLKASGLIIFATSETVSTGNLDSVGISLKDIKPGVMTSYEYTVTPELLTLSEPSPSADVPNGCKSPPFFTSPRMTHFFN